VSQSVNQPANQHVSKPGGLRVGMIGYGAIGAVAHRVLTEQHRQDAEIVGVLVRDPQRLCASSAAHLLVNSLDALLACRPDLIVECAGHAAVDAHAVKVLEAGLDLMLVSIGSLSDAAREQRVVGAARAAHRQLLLPAGAIGGIDWLAAARIAGLTRVTYRSRKPPQAWKGSPAESLLALDSLGTAATFFQGTARAAAHDYPKNANVDATGVELIADPAAGGNIHEIEASGAAGSISVRIDGKPDPHNPRTSMLTAYSVVRGIVNRASTIVI
jgi:aspartate dehydrogenase